MFRVTTHDPSAGVPYNAAEDFFNKEAYLTVSGQLNGEYYACAMSSIYTFGPTFRAEKSHTQRHLAEFWMIEPEIAFADLNVRSEALRRRPRRGSPRAPGPRPAAPAPQDDMNLAEAYLKYCFQHVLDHCDDDLAFIEKTYPAAEGEATARQRLRNIVDTEFVRITYTEAVERLRGVQGKAWQETPEWGKELQTEHERYLCEHVFPGKPVIVYNYPKQCKAYYMRENDGCAPDRQTVAAMDVLFPQVRGPGDEGRRDSAGRSGREEMRLAAPGPPPPPRRVTRPGALATASAAGG